MIAASSKASLNKQAVLKMPIADDGGAPQPSISLPRFRRMTLRHGLNLIPRVLLRTLCVCTLVLPALSVWGQAFDTPESRFWVANGPVLAVARDDDNIYLGGDFSYVGPNTGNAVSIDTVTGKVQKPYAEINGSVLSIIPDSSGGWYVGGSFTHVGGTYRPRLARILADGSLDSTFNAAANGSVRSMALADGVLYFGGSFNSVGLPASGGVALDSATGLPLPPLTAIDGIVYAAAPDPFGGWFVGGQFETVGGQARKNIAHIFADGTVNPLWNPGADGISSRVRALVLSGPTLYVGGSFTKIDKEARNNIAALHADTGRATHWNPDANTEVLALATGDSIVYAGGTFLSIGGENRNRIAALDKETGLATEWDPDSSSFVEALALSGSTVYAGGRFASIGGESRNFLAALDAGTGTATSWDPNAGSAVLALAVSDSVVYAGGFFTSIGGETRNRIAAVDRGTGIATSWNPSADGSVNALAVSGSTVYAGGNFGSIGGESRFWLAALDAASGAATEWSPSPNATVRTVSISGSVVYAGGDFTAVGSQARQNLAAVDATTGLPTTWNPQANLEVFAVAASGSSIYAGGNFTTIGGQARSRLAAIDSTTGEAKEWVANADAAILALAVSGSTLYAGGVFQNVNGQARGRIAALDAATGALLPWNAMIPVAPLIPGSVRTIAVHDSTVYLGGSFGSVGGQPRNQLAAVDATTGSIMPWNPDASIVGEVRAMTISGSTVYVGGSAPPASFGVFTNPSTVAAFDSETGTAVPSSLLASDAVLVLVASDSTLFAGGSFRSFGGERRNRIAALDAQTGELTPWNPGASSIVRALAVSGSTVYAGGFFTSIGGESRNRIAALDADSGLATAWNPNSNRLVTSLLASESTIYAGGDFETIGGQARNRIAALDVTTGQATSWNPDANGTVSVLGMSGSTLYAGGSFSRIGNEDRTSIAALDLLTGTATAWDPNPSGGAVIALLATNDTVYVAGSFSMIGGQERLGSAALDATTGLATPWNFDLPISALALSDSTIFAGTNTGAALDAISGVAKGWNPKIVEGTSLSVNDFAVSDCEIVAAGGFSFVGGKHRRGVAVFTLESDGDGVSNCNENGAPNDGDGNRDGVPDRLQPHVVSLPAATTGAYITLVAPSEDYQFRRVSFSPEDGPYPSGVTGFPFGRVSFDLELPIRGESPLLQVFYSEEPDPESIANLFAWDGSEWVRAIDAEGFDPAIRRFQLVLEDGGPLDLTDSENGLIRGNLAPSSGEAPPSGDRVFADRFELSDAGGGLTCPDDDPFEPNDARDAAARIPTGIALDAIVCGGNPDYFVFSAAEGDTLDILLTFLHLAGDLDMALYREGETSPLVTAESSSDNEFISYLVPLGEGGDYIVGVFGSGSTSNIYSLQVDLQGASN